MRLIKATPTEHPIDGTVYEESLEDTSEDIDTLKALGNSLAKGQGYLDVGWSNLYPVMGDDEIKDVKEFEMRLPNGVSLQIRQ
jgi:hypothetical protein